jgi:hypothetical protein
LPRFYGAEFVFPSNPIPESSTLVVVGIGALGLVWMRRRKT